ncbi:MAG: amidase family protein [Xenococcaceae cyanobacterium]
MDLKIFLLVWIRDRQMLFNLTGNPVVVIPIGQSKEGLPIGIQIAGKRWHDLEVLRFTQHNGEEKLAKWIDSETELGVVREDLLVKMFAGHLVDRQVLINQLEQQRRLYQKHLLKLQEKEVFHNFKFLEREHFCQNLTLQMGFRYYQSWIDWCDESIEKLRKTE